MPLKTSLVTPLGSLLQNIHELTVYCQLVRVKKSNIPGFTKQGYGNKWQTLKWSEEDCQILEHTETSKLCGTLVMKIMKKNAGEHKMNQVIQKLTAAGLHIDNEELLKNK